MTFLMSYGLDVRVENAVLPDDMRDKKEAALASLREVKSSRNADKLTCLFSNFLTFSAYQNDPITLPTYSQ